MNFFVVALAWNHNCHSRPVTISIAVDMSLDALFVRFWVRAVPVPVFALTAVTGEMTAKK